MVNLVKEEEKRYQTVKQSNEEAIQVDNQILEQLKTQETNFQNTFKNMIEEREKESQERANREAKFLMRAQLNYKKAQENQESEAQKDAEAKIFQEKAHQHLMQLQREETSLKESLSGKTQQIEEKLNAAQDALKSAQSDGNELKIEASERVLKLILEEKEKVTKDLKSMREDILSQKQQLSSTKEEVLKIEKKKTAEQEVIKFWSSKVEQAKKQAAFNMIEEEDKHKKLKERMTNLESQIKEDHQSILNEQRTYKSSLDIANKESSKSNVTL